MDHSRIDLKEIARNRLKANLKAGKAQIGAFITAPCPEVVEVLGCAGFDFVVLDTEHTASGIETVVDMMRAAEIYGMTPIVRVPDDTPKNLARYLDVGAHGVQIPMVHTAEQAAAIVQAMKYPTRGMSGGRGPRWGLLENYRAFSNEETMVIVMCESMESVKNIREIVRVPGIDAVFIGAFDLSQSMGVPGETMCPPMEEAIQSVLDACKEAGVIPGAVAPTVEMARKRLKQGFTYVTILDDMAFFAQAAVQRLAEVKA